MLVLSRGVGQGIVIGKHGEGQVRITVEAIRGNQVRIGVEAERMIPVHRDEVAAAIEREGRARAET
jgi:carbon storage regulator